LAASAVSESAASGSLRFDSRNSSRYNRFALQRLVPKRLSLFPILSFCILLFAGCSVPLGPGYLIQKQALELRFVPSPEPHLVVRCTYELINSGSQPLQSIRIVAPAAESFHRSATTAEWNGQQIAVQTITAASAADRGDIIELKWNDLWTSKQKRSLVLDYELSTGSHLASFLAVSPDTFFADPGSWNPELLPPKGPFSVGGTPPKKWTLSVRVPNGFLVHASGVLGKKPSRSSDEIVYSYVQRPGGFAPFAAGGKYVEKEIRSDGERILFWTLQPLDPSAAQNAAAAISSRVHYYETEYGKGGRDDRTIRLLECMIPTQAFGCGALPETVFVHQAWIARGLKDKKFYDDANFELAYTWFGGVSRVRFDEYPLPMDGVAPYAGWEAQAMEEAGDARATRIHWLLSDFDKHAANCKEKIILPLPAGSHDCSYSAAWSKSGLFLFALEDRIGRARFHEALKYMIQARRGRDFSLEDLIASLESESRQPQGQFVREWLKNPGIPDTFRARYSTAVAPAENSSKESQQ